MKLNERNIIKKLKETDYLSTYVTDFYIYIFSEHFAIKFAKVSHNDLVAYLEERYIAFGGLKKGMKYDFIVTVEPTAKGKEKKVIEVEMSEISNDDIKYKLDSFPLTAITKVRIIKLKDTGWVKEERCGVSKYYYRCFKVLDTTSIATTFKYKMFSEEMLNLVSWNCKEEREVLTTNSSTGFGYVVGGSVFQLRMFPNVNLVKEDMNF